MTAAPLDPSACHRAISGRDRRLDGRLWCGVTTTGVFCRPSCPSRTPRPESCRWFASAREATAAGFRACLRCRPQEAHPSERAGEAETGRHETGTAPVSDGGPGPSLTLRLRRREPFAVEPLRRFLAAHAVPGLERHDADPRDPAPDSGAPQDGDPHDGAEPGEASRHTRTVPGPSGPAVVTVTLDAGRDHVLATVLPAAPGDVGQVVARVRAWLDLDADPAQVDRALASDPLLAPLVAARPGLRVPGAVDGLETALLAVLGQQVSLRAARTFAGRLVAAFGAAAPQGLLRFPTAGDLAAAGPEALRGATGVTGARARTLHALAEAAADGLALHPGVDRAATRARLLAVPGIGPWTADYVALRALGDPDAFPSDDLVLKRALGVRTAREAEQRAAGWRPWRGYALLHLWTREVFS